MNYFLIGLSGGFVSNLLGIGAGSVYVPAMVLLLNVPQLNAQASSLLLISISAALGLFTYRQQGIIYSTKGIIILPFALAGLLVGVFAARHIPVIWIRRIFSVVLIIIAFNRLLPQQEDMSKT